MSAAPHARNRVTATADQHAASDPNASVWVTANAGTGKTHVLIDRVTRLLLGGTPPARILCLTFTKAAAAEMEERLFRRLGGWATQPDAELRDNLQGLAFACEDREDLHRARRLFARALETPGGLKIRTIHAFCESLLRRFPLEAQVPPHFEVLDERAASELMAQAREQVLARAQADMDLPLKNALERLVRLIDEPVFVELADDAVAKLRHLSDPSDGRDIGETVARLYAHLGIIPGLSPEDVVAEACSQAAVPEDDLRHAAEVLAEGTKTDIARSDAIAAFLGADTRETQFDAYCRAFLTQEGKGQKKLITKALAEAHPDVHAMLFREQERILAVMEKLKSVRVAEATGAALRIGSEITAAYVRQKSARVLLDYDDLIERVRALLGSRGAEWVLYKLDEGLDHVLVDEAQDTSPGQWDIIRRLSEEFFAGTGARAVERAHTGKGSRTVFAVGDEKQSIYSFQGADPASFAAMRDHFSVRVGQAGLNWRDVGLIESFRSTPGVLEAVDRVFAQDTARTGLSADGDTIRHQPVRIGDSGRVEIWPPIAPADDAPPGPWDAPLDATRPSSPRAILAENIVGQIADWLENQTLLPSKGRPIQPDDILILVRRRNEFVEETIRKLKQRDIPVAGADRMVLTDQIAVMDLIAAGSFALMPEDDLTLATLLRSPLCGLSEDDLFRLAAGRKEARLWHELQARRGELSAFGQSYEVLAALLAMADRTAPHAFFATLLGPMGGRRKLVARLGADANDPIDEFLSLALQYQRNHAPSLQGFLHWIGHGRTEIKRDLEQGGGAVRVMTVHAAKGLEANIVFLPDTCSAPNARFDPKLLQVPGEDFVLWPVKKDNDDAACAAARELVHAARDAEYRRLLYVAMTRARDWLYVCGYEGKNTRPAHCWYDLIAEALTPDAETVSLPWGETGWRIEGRQDGAIAEAAPVPIEDEAPPLPGWAMLPAPEEPEPSVPLAPSRPDGEEPPVHSPRAADDSARFKRGLLIHQLLQCLPDLSLPERESAARGYLMQPVHGLSAEMVDAIIRETLAVLENLDFAPVFGPGSRAEVPIAGSVATLGAGAVISGQVDRLCVTDEQVLVIDFKTNRPPPRVVEEVSAVYLRQMVAYREALRAVYPDRAVRCALLWTDGPHLMELPDSLLDDMCGVFLSAPA